MNKHQELRDAIRNLMKDNDSLMKTCKEMNSAAYNLAHDTILEQNHELQAILDAHK